MNQHLDQANHNLDFHECISSNFTDRFCDWKITVLFYVAIHYMKALALQNGVNIGDTHTEIEKSVRPNSPTAKMQITNNAWGEYKSLYNYSRTARYEGITDIATFDKLKQIDHSYCLKHLDNFKKYIVGRGVKIPPMDDAPVK